MTTSARPNANVSPTSGAATMYTTIWTSPFRRIFPRMTAGRSPASRPARIVVPSVGRCLRMMTSYAKNDAAPSTNAIPVTKTRTSVVVVLGRRIDPGPAASAAAPMMPPMSAWLLDVGRPHSQVIRSHTIAPTTPAMMMAIEWRNAAWLSGRALTPRTLVSMIPLPIVSAMAFVMKTIPTKLPAAAMATAFVGVRTFVATIVAIAFAASWNPLKKSNEKTTRIATTRIAKRSAIPGPCLRASSFLPRESSEDSLILRHDVAEHVGDVLAMVRGLLQDLRDFLELDDRHGILLTEEGRDGIVHEFGGEGLDVLPVDRSDERLVQFLVDPMDDLVAVVLHVLDPSALHRHVAEVV